MEKHHFLDRPEESKERKNLRANADVFVCEKNMQKKASRIEHLTRVIVKKNLTSQEFHPRGQKVKGFGEDGREIVGRVTYICDGINKIRTNVGIKYLGKKDGKYFILDSVENLGQVYLIFRMKVGEKIIQGESLLFPFEYFAKEEFLDSLKTLEIPKCYLSLNGFYTDAEPFKNKEIKLIFNGNTLDIKMLMIEAFKENPIGDNYMEASFEVIPTQIVFKKIKKG